MDRRSLIDRLTKLATATAAEAKAREEELAAMRGPARPGDLIVIPTDTAVIHWLIVKAHPEDPQILFAVPADDNPETGPADVRVPAEHPWGPVTLRCGFGLWVEADLLDPPRRAGVMHEEVLGPVQAVLGQLAAGTYRPTPEQAVLDFDPDYMAWLGEVEKSREAASRWLEGNGQVYRWDEMEAEAPAILRPYADRIVPPAVGAGPPRLAAEGGGPEGRIARHPTDADQARWLRLDDSGALFLVAGTDGVRAIWAVPSRKPPRLQWRSGEDLEPGRWAKEGEFFATAVRPWSEDRVVLQVGPGQGRKVVVRR
jgi:hypothetical protein